MARRAALLREEEQNRPAVERGTATGQFVLILCLTMPLFPASNSHGQEPKEAEKESPKPAAAATRTLPEALNFANGLLQARRYDVAAEEYEKFLETAEPGLDAADARYGLAVAYQGLGKYLEARKQFELFLAMAPTHPNVPIARFRVGEASYMLNDLAGARKTLETFVRQYPEHRYSELAWPYLGDVRFSQRDFAGARESYQSALEKYPKGRLTDRAQYGLGRSLAMLNQPEQALEQFRTLAQRGGEWTERAYYQIGQVEAARGKLEECLQALERLEAVAPRSSLIPEARWIRAETLLKLKRHGEAQAILKPLADDPSTNLAARAAYTLGLSYMESDQPAQALSVWEASLMKSPKSPLAPALLFRSGEAALKLEKKDAARRFFEQAAEVDPNDPWADDALLRAARLAVEDRDVTEGRRLIAEFKVRHAKSALLPDLQLLEGRLALTADQPKEAIAILSPIAGDPMSPPATRSAARYYLGLSYRASGEEAKAAAILSELAATSSPANKVGADARFVVATGLFEAKKYTEAVDSLRKYLEERPQSPLVEHAWAYLAVSLAELGKLDDARKALESLEQAAPRGETLNPTRVRLAEAALTLKQFAVAEGLFKAAAASTDPSLKSRALSGLGFSQAKQNRPTEAAASFDALLKAAPNDSLAPEAAFSAGRSLESAGQDEPALLAYANVIEKFPKAPQAGAAMLAQARLLSRQHRSAEAAKVFQAYVAKYPRGHLTEAQNAEPSADSFDGTLADYGWALVESDRAEEADAIFRRLLDEYPTSPKAADARLNLAESAYQAKKLDEVEKLLAPLVAETQTSQEKVDPVVLRQALYRWGRTLADRRDWANASAVFGRLESLTTKDDPIPSREARFWKAEVAFQAGEAQAALDALKSLLDEAPQTPAPTDSKPEEWFRLAKVRRVQAQILLEKWQEANDLATTLEPELGPTDPLRAELDYARGRSLQGLARFDEARAAYQSVIDARKVGELAARAQFMRGETYFHQRDFKTARREFLKVDILYDTPRWQAAALLEAGKVYEQLAEWPGALETYDRLVTKFPKEPGADDAKKRMETIRAKLLGGAGQP